MKKLILATIACAFFASPVLASEFNVVQTKMLDEIAINMEKYNADAAKMDILAQKKECTEKAADIEGLKVCLTKFPTEKLQTVSK